MAVTPAVKASAASSLLKFAAPMVLAALGKAVRSGNLSLSSLIGLLTGQKAAYAAALPGPLSRLETYFAAPVREVRQAYTPPPPPPVEKKSSIWRWLARHQRTLRLVYSRHRIAR